MGFLLSPGLADLANGFGTKHVGCRIVQIVDGDTVGMICPQWGYVRGRIVGFDTPEKFSPGCWQEFAQAVLATWQLRIYLWRASNIVVRVRGSDRYGRALAEVRTDGVDITSRMVRAGVARRYGGGARQPWCDKTKRFAAGPGHSKARL